MTPPALFKEEPAKLILNRRAIAAGLASLVAAPLGGRALADQLGRLTNIPLSFDASDFAGEMRDGLFLPDYRYPMARIVFDDGGTTRWMRWPGNGFRQCGVSYSKGTHIPKRNTKAVAIECCAPDKHGSPRYAQLAIG